MNKYIFILLISFSAFCSNLNAQNSPKDKIWTLEECITYAKENNINLKISEQNLSLAQTDYFQSKMNLLPTINGSAFGGYNLGQRLDPYNLRFVNQTTQTLNLNLQANMLLFAGLQNINRIKQNKYNTESNKYTLEQSMNDLSLNIANAYMQVLFATERLEISKKQMALTKIQADRMKVLFDNGAAVRGDYLNVEAQLTTEEINVTKASNQVITTKLSLIQLLNLDADDIKIVKPEIKVGDDLDPNLSPGAYAIYLNAVSNQPGIKSSEFKIRSMQSQLSAAKGAFSPTLTAVVSLGSGYSSLSQRVTDTIINVTPVAPTIYNTFGGDSIAIPNSPIYDFTFKRETQPFGNQMKNNSNTQAGISLSIPLLNYLQNHNNLKRAKISVQNARYELDNRKLQLRNTIQTAYNDALASHKTYLANKKNAESLAEAFQYAEDKFNAGAMNSLDYNNAKTRLNNAELETLISKYEYIYRIKIIDFYLGKTLTL